MTTPITASLDYNSHTLHYTEWTTDGCVTDLAEVNESVVTCHCNHLTNFAILVVSIPLCMCVNTMLVD